MTVSYIGQDSTVVVCMTINCVKMLRDPAACIFVTGAARRVEERQEVELKRQKFWG